MLTSSFLVVAVALVIPHIGYSDLSPESQRSQVRDIVKSMRDVLAGQVSQKTGEMPSQVETKRFSITLTDAFMHTTSELQSPVAALNELLKLEGDKVGRCTEKQNAGSVAGSAVRNGSTFSVVCNLDSRKFDSHLSQMNGWVDAQSK